VRKFTVAVYNSTTSFTVETFVKKRMYRKCIQRFIRKFLKPQVPTKVSKLMKMWWTMGSVCDKMRESIRGVLTEEKVRDIQT
jgi:hypothetical protein